QTGKGPLAKPPLNNIKILNVQGRRQVRFRICFESHNPVDYDVYVMLFDEEKRISSELIKVKYKKERMYIDKSIKLKENVIYFKVAINFKEKIKNWKVK